MQTFTNFLQKNCTQSGVQRERGRILHRPCTRYARLRPAYYQVKPAMRVYKKNFGHQHFDKLNDRYFYLSI
jgi:hypothetical protein